MIARVRARPPRRFLVGSAAALLLPVVAGCAYLPGFGTQALPGGCPVASHKCVSAVRSEWGRTGAIPTAARDGTVLSDGHVLLVCWWSNHILASYRIGSPTKIQPNSTVAGFPAHRHTYENNVFYEWNEGTDGYLIIGELNNETQILKEIANRETL